MGASVVFDTLAVHLREVDGDPSTPLDVQLLEKCELFTSTPEYRNSEWREQQPLFFQVASLLPRLQQDPEPLIHFITKLADPYRFEDVKDIDFEIGLQLEAAPFHELILSLLDKATASSTDAEALANKPNVLLAVVRLWLCTKDTLVATRAAQLLTSLLRVSYSDSGLVTGSGQLFPYGTAPIWKRLFNDRDIYALYYQYTTFSKLTTSVEPALGKRDKTIAQARLLEWLPQVGKMNWETVASSHLPEMEKEVGLADGQGLVHYASSKMVDTADDILMHLTLMNFFSDLITTIKTSPQSTHNSSPSLDFLKEEGIHNGIINFHTSDSPGLEHSFLSPRSAHYIAEYVSNYPDDFEKSPELVTIRQYIQRNIRKCEPHDLSIVAAMPRSTIVPRNSSGLAWEECLLLDIPIKRANPEALKTLAAVFHGPPKEEVSFPAPAAEDRPSIRHSNEQAYARLLTALYYTRNPTLFSDLVTYADTVAMKDNALAALTLLGALITSNWNASTRLDDISATDPIFLRLQEFPKTGVALVLDPTISGSVLPYLLKPATSFSSLVGGRGGAEEAAYQVAMAKFDVLKALAARLKNEGARHDVVSMVQRRVAEGAWGVGGNAGSRIGTLEM